jgi:hypothetical protein
MTERSFIRLGAITAILASFNIAMCLTAPQNRFEVLGMMIVSYSLLLGCLSLARAED